MQRRVEKRCLFLQTLEKQTQRIYRRGSASILFKENRRQPFEESVAAIIQKKHTQSRPFPPLQHPLPQAYVRDAPSQGEQLELAFRATAVGAFEHRDHGGICQGNGKRRQKGGIQAIQENVTGAQQRCVPRNQALLCISIYFQKTKTKNFRYVNEMVSL